MNCKQACDDVALYVGNDLSDHASRRLERHLKKCPSCHKHYQTMKNSLKVLQDSGDQFLMNSLHDSVWPDVSTKLAKSRDKRHKFNGWIPATAVLAASLVVLLVSDFPVNQDDHGLQMTPVSTGTSQMDVNPFSLQGISGLISDSENAGKSASGKTNDPKNQPFEKTDSEGKFLKYISSPSN